MTRSNVVTPPRLAALAVLTRVREGDLVDRALAREGNELDPRDHAWVQELVYGTLRYRGRLDYILGRFVRAGLDSLDPVVLDILRLGTYQLLEMGSVPAYAAVSQSVELARAAGAGRAAGLVNGVLQSVRRGIDTVDFPQFDSNPVEHLITAGSHPRWLIERWIRRWGAGDTRKLVEANNQRPELYLTPVGLGTTEACVQLMAAGVEAEEVPRFPDSLRVTTPEALGDALSAIPAVVQDPAAAMVVHFAEVSPHATVFDMSAAPGGKTAGLADRARFIVAADISRGRLRRVRENVRRTGVAPRVALMVADGRFPPVREVDTVFLDAPCTGTGTLRRHPDGRWRIDIDQLAALTALQRDLLDGAAKVVRAGGLLVYATCSLEPEENEEQVERFLKRHPDFHIEAPSGAFDGTMVQNGLLSVLPQRHGVDGAFAARLRRAE